MQSMQPDIKTMAIRHLCLKCNETQCIIQIFLAWHMLFWLKNQPFSSFTINGAKTVSMSPFLVSNWYSDLIYFMKFAKHHIFLPLNDFSVIILFLVLVVFFYSYFCILFDYQSSVICLDKCCTKRFCITAKRFIADSHERF